MFSSIVPFDRYAIFRIHARIKTANRMRKMGVFTEEEIQEILNRV